MIARRIVGVCLLAVGLVVARNLPELPMVIPTILAGSGFVVFAWDSMGAQK